MEYSLYNCFYDKGEKVIIYNTFNKNLIELPKNLINLETPDKNNAVVNQQLRNFIVKDKSDELKQMHYWLNSAVFQNTRLNITLMMTLDCNFRCIYCFEGWLNEKKEICELDEKEFVEWLINLIKKYYIKQVDLCFHGGEPTLESKKIYYIADKLRSFFDKNKIFYLFTAVTNGYLLTKKMADEFVSHSIKIVQITIDGVEEVHNKRRPLKNGGKTFTQIINNIKQFKNLKCYVSIVYDSTNYDSLTELLYYFKRENMQNNINMIILGEVKPIIKDNEIFDESLSQKKDAEIRLSLIKLITKLGFKVPFDLEYQLCTMKQKGSFVITPNKKIYKCISGVGQEEFYLTDLSKNIDPFSKQAKFLISESNQECLECQYFPICNSNCLYESKITGKSKICKKVFWKNYILGMIEILQEKQCRENIIFNPNLTEWSIHYDE